MVLFSNRLYGTATEGGKSDGGIIFAINTDGSGFTKLHDFGVFAANNANLVLTNNLLYGTSFNSLFTINTNGSNFSKFFTTNVGFPFGSGLVVSGNTVFGVDQDNGFVFSIQTNSKSLTILHSFNQTNDGGPLTTGLILSGNTLYGTASYGGSFSNGTVYAMNTDGTGLTNLHNFTRSNDGANPFANLVLSGKALYGTTTAGGSHSNGTIFSISFEPELKVAPSGSNLVFSWPTNVAGFSYTGYELQSTTNLGPAAVWNTNLPAPVAVNGRNVVTNPISGNKQFYRLIQ